MAKAFIAGVVYWGIMVLFMFLGGTLLLVGLAMLLGVIFLIAVKGWNWLSEYKFGTYGHFLKFLAIMFLMCTVIGNLPVIYWTGKGIFRYTGYDLD